MNRIKVLDGAVASRIAAGEVVTSPASVVKELVENSIDAGASAITIEIANGGRDAIRVTDNGSGIVAEDVQLAVEKHATSKVRDFSDLDAIDTLGFRGEALFSMAAVSRFTISTRTKDSISGTVLKINGGGGKSIMPAGLPEGTTVKVEKLFYNVPARQKFLVNSRNEAARVGNVVSRLILSHEELSIKYINNGKVVYHSSGNGKLLDALIAVYGFDIADKVLEMRHEENGIVVCGYISRPSFLNKASGNITFIVNGRYIQSKLLHEALVQGYGERLLKSHYPFAVLHITMPSKWVDVNVHPNKTQVLFSNDAALRESIVTAVGEALWDNLPPMLPLNIVPEPRRETEVAPEAAAHFAETEQEAVAKALPLPQDKPTQALDTAVESHETATKLPVLNSDKYLNNKLHTAADSSGKIADAINSKHFEKIMDEVIEQAQEKQLAVQTEIQDVRQLVDYTVIGQAFQTYLIVECENTLYLIDQHAAHERITYETLKENVNKGLGTSQQLLTPYIKKFSPADFELVSSHIELLEQLGFEIEEFGPLTYKFSALPTQVEQSGMDSLTDEVVFEIKNNPKNVLLAREKVIQAACKHSIKAGYSLAEEQIAALMDDITQMDAIPTCPHGRPIAIALTKSELQKGFKRLV